MSAYVTMFKYTGPTKGGGPERFKMVQQIVAEANGKILHVYGLLGAYDIIAVTEFPDNRAAMKAAAKIGNLINAQTHTMGTLLETIGENHDRRK